MKIDQLGLYTDVRTDATRNVINRQCSDTVNRTDTLLHKDVKFRKIAAVA